MLASGLDGIRREVDPGPPLNRNIFDMTSAEKEELNITQLPGTLNEALQELKVDSVLQGALGEHIFSHFIQAKEAIWREYRAQVHSWELDQYLGSY